LDPDFRQRSDHELSRLSDDGLIDHIRLARRARRPGEGKRALRLLVVRNERDVHRRVSLKVPPADVEDVTQQALISAIASAFAGESVGEFRGWLNRIVKRRIADYHRDRKREPDTTALVEEHGGEEDVWGQEPESVEPDEREVELRVEVARLINELSAPRQAVVILYCYMEWPAAEVSAEVNERFPDLPTPMSDNNVQQIGSRFRRELRERLDGDDTS
jgi:RNA polymerase sigma factor (sigma-70 family)